MIYATFDYRFLILAVLIGLLAGSLLSRRGKVDKSKISGIDLDTFMDMKRKGTLVDIRKESLYKMGKIIGAKNMPNSSGAKNSSIRKDIPIFIYDEDGRKANGVAKNYVRNGAVMVYYLKGGYKEYNKEK